MSKVTYNKAVLKGHIKVNGNKKQNNQLNNTNFTRTIKIYHGKLEDVEFIGKDGLTYLKPTPMGGIRYVSVHHTCQESSHALAKSYDGYILSDEQLKPRLKPEVKL